MRVLDLPAAPARQVAGEERLQFDDQRELLRPLHLLLEQVRADAQLCRRGIAMLLRLSVMAVMRRDGRMRRPVDRTRRGRVVMRPKRGRMRRAEQRAFARTPFGTEAAHPDRGRGVVDQRHARRRSAGSGAARGEQRRGLHVDRRSATVGELRARGAAHDDRAAPHDPGRRRAAPARRKRLGAPSPGLRQPDVPVAVADVSRRRRRHPVAGPLADAAAEPEQTARGPARGGADPRRGVPGAHPDRTATSPRRAGRLRTARASKPRATAHKRYGRSPDVPAADLGSRR